MQFKGAIFYSHCKVILVNFTKLSLLSKKKLEIPLQRFTFNEHSDAVHAAESGI